MNPVGKFLLRCAAIAPMTLAAGLLIVQSALAQTAIRFSLDSRIDGAAAPFLLAIDKGYFRAEGLDVTIDPASSPLDPITRIASGSHDAGFADINALIKQRDAHPPMPIKAVFMVYNRPAFAIIGRKSRGIEKPKDLEGKILGAPAADPAYAQWKAFAQANGIDSAKVKIESVGFPVREPMLQSGQVDAITGLSFQSFINLKTMNVPADDLVVLPMADYGLDLYGNAIVVSPKLAADNPDAVKGLLRALVKALKETAKSPSDAVEAVIKRDDAEGKSVALERLHMVLKDNVLTHEVKTNGYGAVDPDRLAKSIDQIAQGYEFKNKAKAAEAFDPSFLPPAAERMVH